MAGYLKLHNKPQSEALKEWITLYVKTYWNPKIWIGRNAVGCQEIVCKLLSCDDEKDEPSFYHDFLKAINPAMVHTVTTHYNDEPGQWLHFAFLKISKDLSENCVPYGTKVEGGVSWFNESHQMITPEIDENYDFRPAIKRYSEDAKKRLLDGILVGFDWEDFENGNGT